MTLSIQPKTQRMLGIMLREMEQTVIPDLATPHACTVAFLIAQGLRNLLVREEGLPSLIEDWNGKAATLLEAADAWPGDAVARQYALGSAIEVRAVTHVEAAHSLDAFCRQAVLLEQAHYRQRADLVATATVPQQSDARRVLTAMTPERLSAYFSNRLGRDARVTDAVPILSGYSKETILVDMMVEGDAMPVVIRRDVPHSTVESTVVDEYPLLEALYRHGMPVPEPILMETDRSLFGEAFIVTARAPGVVAADSMASLEGRPEMRQAAIAFARFLARLHGADLAALDLPRTIYDPGLSLRDYLVREVETCEHYYRRHRLQPSPTIGVALAWLRCHIPEATEPPRLIHGDAWLSNMLMDGDRMSVMLDWELARPSDPTLDLAYGRKWMEQIMPWDEFLAHYHAADGPLYRADREPFYTLLSDVKIMLYSVRTMDLLRTSDHPAISHMYSAVHYYGYFADRVADDLLRLG